MRDVKVLEIIALKKELARVRKMNAEYRSALYEQAQEKGFFNPLWGVPDEEWLKSDDDDWVTDRQSRTIEPGEGINPDTLTLVYEQLKAMEANLLRSPQERQKHSLPEINKIQAKISILSAESRREVETIATKFFQSKHPRYKEEPKIFLSTAMLKACWQEYP